VINVL